MKTKRKRQRKPLNKRKMISRPSESTKKEKLQPEPILMKKKLKTATEILGSISCGSAYVTAFSVKN